MEDFSGLALINVPCELDTCLWTEKNINRFQIWQGGAADIDLRTCSKSVGEIQIILCKYTGLYRYRGLYTVESYAHISTWT